MPPPEAYAYASLACQMWVEGQRAHQVREGPTAQTPVLGRQEAWPLLNFTMKTTEIPRAC